MKALLPLAPAQFEYLGFPSSYAKTFENEFAAARYCLPENAPYRNHAVLFSGRLPGHIRRGLGGISLAGQP